MLLSYSDGEYRAMGQTEEVLRRRELNKDAMRLMCRYFDHLLHVMLSHSSAE